MARTRIPHQLRVPAPDRLEHDADEAWRRDPLTAIGRTRQTRRDRSRRHRDGAVADRRRRGGRATDTGPALRRQPGRGPNGADTTFLTGEAVEFLRWTVREAPDAKGYWPATAVANHALAGEAVVDNATASTMYPLFDGTGWSQDRCAECGATADHMPRVEETGVGGGPTARCRRHPGRRFRRRPVRAACRGRRPRRRRARAVRYDADRVDHHSRLSRSARPVDRAAHHGGKVSDRRAEQRRWALSRVGGPPCGRGQLDSGAWAAAGVVAVCAR